MRWTKRQPWPMTRALLKGKSLHIFRSPEIVREKFFSQRTPEAEVLRYAGRADAQKQRRQKGFRTRTTAAVANVILLARLTVRMDLPLSGSSGPVRADTATPASSPTITTAHRKSISRRLTV